MCENDTLPETKKFAPENRVSQKEKKKVPNQPSFSGYVSGRFLFIETKKPMVPGISQNTLNSVRILKDFLKFRLCRFFPSFGLRFPFGKKFFFDFPTWKVQNMWTFDLFFQDV